MILKRFIHLKSALNKLTTNKKDENTFFSAQGYFISEK